MVSVAVSQYRSVTSEIYDVVEHRRKRSRFYLFNVDVAMWVVIRQVLYQPFFSGSDPKASLPTWHFTSSCLYDIVRCRELNSVQSKDLAGPSISILVIKCGKLLNFLCIQMLTSFSNQIDQCLQQSTNDVYHYQPRKQMTNPLIYLHPQSTNPWQGVGILRQFN